KDIDTENRNLVSRAPGSKTDEGFYPVGPLSVRNPINTKTNKEPGEKEHTHPMHSFNQLKTLVSCGRDPARSLPLRRGFLLIPLILVSFALCQQVQAAPSPETPDPGALPLSNTADGDSALASITSAGIYNSAFGFFSLLVQTDADFCTGVGAGTLLLNNANENTAVGAGALFSNTDGDSNDAVGFNALGSNADGLQNNAMGFDAMADNVSGSGNVAVGDSAGAGVEGNFNIYIGWAVTPGVNEDNTIRIGDTDDAACFIGGISGVPVT